MTNAGKIEEATPRPWSVRTLNGRNGKVQDCFVTAADVNGFAYGAEIMGDDEYRGEHGITRKVADAQLIVRAVNAHPNLLSVLKQIEDFSSDPTSVSLARAAREYVGSLP